MKKIIYTLLLAVLLIGCRAQKIDTAIERTTNAKDSADTELTVTSDSLSVTTYTTQTDSTETTKETDTEKEEQTHINFVDGGGTYNAETGEATGVASVNTSKREKTLEKENAKLKRENTELKEELQREKELHLQEHTGSETTEEVKEENHLEQATLNGWQRFIQGCGYAFLMILLAAIIYGAYRLYRKFTIGI